ncbi:MAG: TetR family transcriptional regulator [Beijerinckiaceae bacterium]|jgi:AcrR family transcriptional regulator
MTTRILDEAERLFRHYGYSKTTVADIARELGMSPANIYRFFSSKSQIHEALAERMLAAREVALHAIAKRPVKASERLRAFVIEEYEATVTQLLDETKVHEMVTVAIEQHWPVIDRHLQRMTDILSRIIAEGMEDGEFTVTDPIKAAQCFKACVVSVCHPTVVAQCRSDPGNATPEELVDFVLKALKR